MSLQDYEVTRDKFRLHDKGTVGLELSFPCCHCQHRNMCELMALPPSGEDGKANTANQARSEAE